MASLKAAEVAAQKERENTFTRLKKLFHEDLKTRSLVKLWEDRSDKHEKSSQIALISFSLLLLTVVATGILIPIYFGEQISQNFYSQFCTPIGSNDCERVASAKGPLTIAGLLAVISVLMWATRLSYKVYLSERHLRLNAKEKMAFAEAWLAMKEGAEQGGSEVSAENEAIVLGSLFRPTQDGIIKDDEGSLDISAVAMLSKHLSK